MADRGMDQLIERAQQAQAVRAQLGPPPSPVSSPGEVLPPDFNPPLPPNTGPAPIGLNGFLPDLGFQSQQIEPGMQQQLSETENLQALANIGDIAKARQNVQKSIEQLKVAMAKL